MSSLSTLGDGGSNRRTALAFAAGGHGVLCPCGACRAMFSGATSAAPLPLMSGDSIDGASSRALSPPILSAGEKLGLSPRAVMGIATYFAVRYNAETSATLEAATFESLAHFPKPQREAAVSTLNTEFSHAAPYTGVNE